MLSETVKRMLLFDPSTTNRYWICPSAILKRSHWRGRVASGILMVAIMENSAGNTGLNNFFYKTCIFLSFLWVIFDTCHRWWVLHHLWWNMLVACLLFHESEILQKLFRGQVGMLYDGFKLIFSSENPMDMDSSKLKISFNMSQIK